MPGLTPAALLDAWERATLVTPLARPLVLLAAAAPGCDVEDLAAEALGRRDVRLCALRSSLTGSLVDATAACPMCGERVEVVFDSRDVWPPEVDPPATVAVSAGGYEVACRPPTTADLIAAAASDDPPAALFERSVVTAHREGKSVPADALPDAVRLAVEAALGDADPHADMVFSLACPSCSTSWSAPLDVASFVWEEVDHAARQTLAEVDVLARAYGWREPDVLALSPWRRQCYLGLARG